MDKAKLWSYLTLAPILSKLHYYPILFNFSLLS
jgi:hypothetical protein